MLRGITCFLIGALFVHAPLATAQEDKLAPIIEHNAKLPAGARLQLGKLTGFRYRGSASEAGLSADGKLLAVADFRDLVTVVQVDTGKILHRFKCDGVDTCTALRFSTDNSLLTVETT